MFEKFLFPPKNLSKLSIAVQTCPKISQSGQGGQVKKQPVHAETLTSSISGQGGQVGQLKSIKNNAMVLPPHPRMASIIFWMKFASNQKLGDLGEMYVSAWLESQGFKPKNTSQEKHKGDVTATDPNTGEIIRFEVKTAQRGTDNRWQFCLRKKDKTNVAHSDYVVFLLIDDHHNLYRYIVPSELLGKSCKLSLSTHPTRYKGKIAPFLMRSDEIDLLDIQTTYELMGA